MAANGNTLIRIATRHISSWEIRTRALGHTYPTLNPDNLPIHCWIADVYINLEHPDFENGTLQVPFSIFHEESGAYTNFAFPFGDDADVWHLIDGEYIYHQFKGHYSFPFRHGKWSLDLPSWLLSMMMLRAALLIKPTKDGISLLSGYGDQTLKLFELEEFKEVLNKLLIYENSKDWWGRPNMEEAV